MVLQDDKLKTPPHSLSLSHEASSFIKPVQSPWSPIDDAEDRHREDTAEREGGSIHDASH